MTVECQEYVNLMTTYSLIYCHKTFTEMLFSCHFLLLVFAVFLEEKNLSWNAKFVNKT